MSFRGERTPPSMLEGAEDDAAPTQPAACSLPPAEKRSRASSGPRGRQGCAVATGRGRRPGGLCWAGAGGAENHSEGPAPAPRPAASHLRGPAPRPPRPAGPPLTFGVVAGLEDVQLVGVVREGEDLDHGVQHDHDPARQRPALLPPGADAPRLQAPLLSAANGGTATSTHKRAGLGPGAGRLAGWRGALGARLAQRTGRPQQTSRLQ